MPDKIKPIRKIPTVLVEASEGLALPSVRENPSGTSQSAVAPQTPPWNGQVTSGPEAGPVGWEEARVLFACGSVLHPTGGSRDRCVPGRCHVNP